jgi:hypothetical protein
LLGRRVNAPSVEWLATSNAASGSRSMNLAATASAYASTSPHPAAAIVALLGGVEYRQSTEGQRDGKFPSQVALLHAVVERLEVGRADVGEGESLADDAVRCAAIRVPAPGIPRFIYPDRLADEIGALVFDCCGEEVQGGADVD